MRPVALPLVLLVVLAPIAGASAWSAYTGVPVGIACYGLIHPGDCPELSSSAARFGPFDASRIDLTIHDQAMRVVGATYTFYDPEGFPVGHTVPFCDGASDVEVPAGAQYVIVNVDSAITKQHCGALSSGTSGYVGLHIRS